MNTFLYVSSALMTTGIYLNAARHGVVKEDFRDFVREKFPGFHTNMDDYLQWAPAVEMVIADLTGLKPVHPPLHQAGLYAVSVAVNSLLVAGLKDLTGITRPNGGDHAFPSGHTSNAFVNATVLYLEFRDANKFLAWSGYFFATATGILRIMNNAHWVSDVVAGAGVGILVPYLVYTLYPLNRTMEIQNNQKNYEFTFLPVFMPRAVSFSFSWTF